MKPFPIATKRLFRALKRRGIATVHLHWRMRDGMGEVYSIRAFDRAGRRVSVRDPITIALRPTQPQTRYCSLKEALDDCAWTLLEHYHKRSFQNAGGCGTITLDVGARMLVPCSMLTDHRL
jgi:hypothetical protein